LVARCLGHAKPNIARNTKLVFRFRSIGLLVLLCLVTVTFFTDPSLAEVPYRNYSYDFFGNAVPAPQAYLPSKVITGADLSVGEFSDPQDLHVSRDGQIFIADAGNNRLVWLDSDWKPVRVLSEFDNNGTADRLRAPEGVFVADDGSVYVADTGNSRIVQFDKNGEFVRVIGPPEADTEGVIPQGFVYQPIKVAVDPANRIYVVSRNSYEGLTVFNADGRFSGFVGAPRVTPSAADLFWYRIATQEQRQRMSLFLPTQFSNLTVDSKGFVFVVESGPADDDSIRRLNPAGEDVLIRKGFHPPKGDLVASSDQASRFVDIHVDNAGVYRVLDHFRGRVFAYDRNGWLLYVFGVRGELKGSFRDPVAVDMLGEDVLVLDRGQRQIVVFSPTDYARAINAALALYNSGLYDQSAEMWRVVLCYNSNYDLAYSGIGRAVLRQGDLEAALRYYRLGQDRIGYSEAFKQYRRELGLANLGQALTLVIGVLFLTIVASKLGLVRKAGEVIASARKSIANRLDFVIVDSQGNRTPVGRALAAVGDIVSNLRYSLYTAIHPFDGFYEVRHGKKGSVASAVVILALMTLTYVIMRQYTGFVFNTRDLARLNVYTELASVLIPFSLWCAVNWALTTLMDGKGRLRDIFISSAFALVPMILINIPLTVLTNFMVAEDASYYYAISALAVIWTGSLLLIGNMIIHEYSVGKTGFTAVLTLVGMAFVLFLGVLFVSLVNTMVGFVRSLYIEIIFR